MKTVYSLLRTASIFFVFLFFLIPLRGLAVFHSSTVVDGLKFEIWHEDRIAIVRGFADDAPLVAHLTIPATVQDEWGHSSHSVTTIKNGAFRNCTGLTAVTLPASLTTIDNQAFYGCSGLTTVALLSATPPALGLEAFTWSQPTFTCPAEALVAYRAVPEWFSLFPLSQDDVNFYLEDGHVVISGFSLAGAEQTSLTIPATIEVEGVSYPVTAIAEHAFRRCTGLTDITFPDGLTQIGSYAFFDCTVLTDITFPDGLTQIGNSAFSGCTALTTLAFPPSLTTISNGAFFGCTALTGLALPPALTAIGEMAFEYCTGLTALIFPPTLAAIGNNAFWGCRGLTSVTFQSAIPPDLGGWEFIDLEYDASDCKFSCPDGSLSAYQADVHWAPYFADKTSVLHIRSTLEDTPVALYDLQGRLLLRTTLSPGSAIPLGVAPATFPTGLYILATPSGSRKIQL